MQLSPVPTCIILLAVSNVFMTFAWYAHLKDLAARPWWVAAFASWGIALLEYLVQVPAKRQSLKLDYLWASICIMGAVYFIFRDG